MPVRLTLRTLLSYLDDTLEPAQAKIIGVKVTESEQARDLMERIKQVTRRRRLMTPPTSGPGGIDPNTIAEYLDNDVTPEQAAEVEQICLASDVHLAEVAACHQILTLVLGEPALVPPTAKQRMYTLVKGPESIPFRRPAKIAANGDQDLSSEIEPDRDESLRLGLPAVGGAGSQRNLWLLVGGGVLAACLLIFAVWHLVGTPFANVGGDPLAQAHNKDKDKDKDKDPNKKNGTTKEDDKKKTQDDKDKEKGKTQAKKEDPQPDKKLPITTFTPDPEKQPPEIAYKAANPDQGPVGAYVRGDKVRPSVLLQAKARAWGWERVAEKKVDSGRPLLSLSGSKSVVALDTGVELTLWGNLPEQTLDYSVLESRATVHSSVPQLDADLTLERGRIILRNKKAQGKDALIRVRFNDPTQNKEEFFDIVLNGAGAAVVVDRACGLDTNEPFFEDSRDPNRKGPTAIMKVFAYELSANVRSGDAWYFVSKMQQPLLERSSLVGKPVIPEKAVLPPWINGMPDLKDKGDRLAREKSIEAHDKLAKMLDAKPIDVVLAEVYQTAQTNAQREMTGGKPLPSLDTFTLWRHAIRCSAAVDDVSTIYEEFAQPLTPMSIRGLCLQALQQWIAWNRDQDYQLLKAIRTSHPKTVSVKIMSVKIMELFHGISTDDASKPATYQQLIENLNNDVLPIRTLSHWHLVNLAPAGGKILYDPAMPQDRRQLAVGEWKDLIPPGQLPRAGPPMKKKKG
jgi:hypothetical protein